MMNTILNTTRVLAVIVGSLLVTGLTSGADDSADQRPTEPLAARVERVLSKAEAIQSDELMVRDHDGVITIAGRTNSLAVKRRVADIAKQVRDVRAVVNQIIVERTDLDDQTVAACVRRALSVDPVTEKAEIAVTVNRGETGLVGEVSSLAERTIAEQVAAETRGVTNVVNQLVVKLKQPRNDREIKPEIEWLIENSTPLIGCDLKIQVKDGVVDVVGSVGKAWQTEALKRVCSIRGVSAIDVSQVVVDPSLVIAAKLSPTAAIVDDSTIRKTLKSALAADPLVISYADDIDIEVQQGNVTLSGTVGRPRVKDAIEQCANNVKGVKSVLNQTRVVWSGQEISDDQIVHEALAAIERSSYLERHELRVHCRDAHLQLYGIVDSQFEKDVATWTLSGLKGVVHVANHLAIAPAWQSKSDKEIEDALTKKLKQGLLDRKVQGTVKDGVAILRGEVDSWMEWQATLDIALQAGAKTPHSLVRVKGHPPHSASETFVP